MKATLDECTIGGNYIGITENGDYRSCGFHEGYRIGNVKDTKLRTAWEQLQKSEFHLKLRDKSNLKGRCGICEYREICGGCRTRAEYLHRRPLRIRPSMQLHTKSPPRRSQSTRSSAQKPDGQKTITHTLSFTFYFSFQNS